MLFRLLVLVFSLALIAGCGGGGDDDQGGGDGGGEAPVLGQSGDEEVEGPALGFPIFATKNTTRVAGADPVANAAGVAQAVFPARSEDTRPRAVVLVDQADWRSAISAAQLMAPPLRAPVLFTDGGEVPEATAQALENLKPTGSREAGGAQVIRIGDAPVPEGYESTDVKGAGPVSLARAIDRLQTSAAGEQADAVVVAAADSSQYAMPAAGWAAKSGQPVLWTNRNALPAETRAAIEAHRRARIYVLGPEDAISDGVVGQLERLGTVKRVAGNDPVTNAIAFARYSDGRFGWNVVDPGHGLVFANARQTQNAAAAAPLSAAGTYGPLLLLPDAATLPAPLQEYLLDIQPGYDEDPVRGVYNHGWLIGDESAISAGVQARIDTLLEIQPVETEGD